MTRERTSEETEALVLQKSRRRCCLCFGLNSDFDMKRGQLAHINHDSSDSKAANLAFLCLEHHDLYDSRTSQSKGFSKSELLQYRNMLYDFIENTLPTAKTHSILKHANECFSSMSGATPTATQNRGAPQAGSDGSLAPHVEDDDQKDISRSDYDYITNSTQEIQKELLYLSDRLIYLKDEKISAESLGLPGSVKTVDIEINKIRSRIKVCRERNSIIEAGYDLWDTTGFGLTCECGCFLDIWDTIGEMKGGTFCSNPESEMRIPMATHEYFRKAIDSRLFTRFLVCLLYEDRDFFEEDKLGTDCDYYLFGKTFLDDSSVYLVAAWTTNDL